MHSFSLTWQGNNNYTTNINLRNIYTRNFKTAEINISFTQTSLWQKFWPNSKTNNAPKHAQKVMLMSELPRQLVPWVPPSPSLQAEHSQRETKGTRVHDVILLEMKYILSRSLILLAAMGQVIKEISSCHLFWEPNKCSSCSFWWQRIWLHINLSIHL